MIFPVFPLLAMSLAMSLVESLTASLAVLVLFAALLDKLPALLADQIPLIGLPLAMGAHAFLLAAATFAVMVFVRHRGHDQNKSCKKNY